MAKLNNPPDNDFALRDYHHAAKIFTTQPGYPLAPYHSFLFHVFIEFNKGSNIPVGDNRQAETRTISVLVKAADLPNFKFDTEVLNQYNRKRIVYKKINYEPMQIRFQDDVAQTVRNMWIDYNQYYIGDSNKTFQQLTGSNVYQVSENFVSSYGLDNGSTIPFIKSIKIFSMGNHEYSAIELINPVISSMDFDTHDYANGSGTMELTMAVEYETVLYSSGTTESIKGFGEDNIPFYDNNYNNSSKPEQDDIDTGQRAATPEISINRNAEIRQNIERLVSQSVDRVPGRVNRNQIRFTENQFLDLNQSANQSISNSRETFRFPEAKPLEQLDQFVDLLKKDQLQDTEIGRSDQVESNGGNISARNQNVTVGRFGNNTSQQKINAMLIVQPIIPENLTPAERALFIRSYPPLSSTDPRSKQPPYV